MGLLGTTLLWIKEDVCYYYLFWYRSTIVITAVIKNTTMTDSKSSRFKFSFKRPFSVQMSQKNMQDHDLIPS